MDLFHLFDCLTSDLESDRKLAYDAFEGLLVDPHLYNILFEILSTTNLEQKYYILASECLITWFKRNTINESEKTPFIQKLQSFLLINHPAQKEIFFLYSITFNIHVLDIHVTFLGDSINLISLDTPPEILVLALKLSSLTSYKFINTLNQSIKIYTEQLLTEINNRLVLILRNAKEFLSFPIGCEIIRHSFETIFYSTRRCQFNEELFPLIFETLHLILQNFSNIQDNEFYLLVSFCYRMIEMFKKTSSNKIVRNLNLTEEQTESLNQERSSLIIQFIIALAPYHLEAINNFLQLPSFNPTIIPESPDFIQVIIEIATLTEADLSDYYDNPAIFYSYAYPSKYQSNSRRLIFDLVSLKCHKSETYQIVHSLISQPPSEAVFYLVGSIIRKIMFADLPVDEEVFQWIIECINQQIPFQSPLLMSTFLFLVSKTVGLIASDEFLEALAPIIYKIVALSALEENEIKNDIGNELTSYSVSKEFIIACSKSLVTVTNAIRVARKIIDKCSIEFPPEMLYSVAKLIPISLTSDTARFIKNFIDNAHSNPEKAGFFMSQVESIKHNLCEAAMSAIASASAFQSMLNISSLHKNEEMNEFEIIKNTLITLDEIIRCEGDNPTISDEMVLMIESLFPNFDKHFSYELNKIIKTLFFKGFTGSPHIMGVLTETIESTKELLYDMDEFYFLYLFFMMMFRDAFIEMNMAPTVAMFGLETFKIPKVSHEDDLQNKQSIGIDLICFSIQTDHNFDVSTLIQFVEEESQLDCDFFKNYGIMIMMSLLVSRPQIMLNQENLLGIILEWALGNNANCPYEKRLAALSLMILNNSDDVMKVAIELLSQEKKQRESLATASLPTCHCHRTPIEQIDLLGTAQTAVKQCSTENQNAFIVYIRNLYSEIQRLESILNGDL